MTTAQELRALAERVMAGDGPDKEVDQDVHDVRFFGHTTDAARPFCEKYTASLNAAMTLVPEGWAVEKMSIWPGKPAHVCLCGTHDYKGQRWHKASDGRVEAAAATPALALTAAALLARAAQMEPDA